jgi:hypothetical protein
MKTEKTKEYQQFKVIENRLCTFLSDHKLSKEKQRKPIVTYKYIWELVEQHAESMGLDTTKYLEWLILRSLAHSHYLSIEVEKREPPSLDFTESKTRYNLPSHLNGKRAYLKIFGNDLQRKAINNQDRINDSNS